MPQKNTIFQKIYDFFATRFILRENSLWRVLMLIKPMRNWVIGANALLFLASVLSAFVPLTLMGLFQFTLNPDKAEKGIFDTRALKSTTVTTSQSLALTGAAPAAKANRGIVVTEGKDGREKIDVKRGGFRKTVEKVRFIKHLDDKIQREYVNLMLWGQSNRRGFVLAVMGFLLLILLVQGLIQFAGDSMMGKVGIDTTGRLLRQIYGNVLDQEMKFFDQTSTGTLINTCYREVFELRNIITFLASTRLMLPIQMGVLFLTLLFVSAKFTFMLCALLPFVILPTMILTRQLKKSIHEMMQGEARPIDIMTEAFHGIRAIKAFSAEDYEKMQMEPAVADYESFANKRRSAQAMIEPTVDILNTLVMMLVFVAICLLMPDSLQKEQGQLLAFMYAVQRFYRPFRSLMTMNLSMQRSAMAARRIFTLLDRKPRIVDAEDAVEFPREWRELVFDDVYLAYEVFFKGQSRLRKALRGVSLRIRRGEAVSFVGPNGAGKSSIVNLICRLYDPTGGAIYFDDVPLSDIRLKSLREKVCLITQHPILFNRSVAENIAFGLEGISQEHIEEAAHAVNAHAFITNLPDGYESIIGEQGRLLSGGERQKIVLARAFVRRPDILILDEPTTGLDKETTQEFLELIVKLRRQGMTIVYITHEHTHLNRFDRVLQLTPERKVREVTPEDAAAALIDEVLKGSR